MNAHQRRVHRREAERAFQQFRTAGIPVEQARHWAEARAARKMVEDKYDPDRPIIRLFWLNRAITWCLAAGVAAAGVALATAVLELLK